MQSVSIDNSFFILKKVDVKTHTKAFVTCLESVLVMGLVKNFLPDADSLKTFWHLGCQDAALFPPLKVAVVRFLSHSALL